MSKRSSSKRMHAGKAIANEFNKAARSIERAKGDTSKLLALVQGLKRVSKVATKCDDDANPALIENLACAFDTVADYVKAGSKRSQRPGKKTVDPWLVWEALEQASSVTVKIGNSLGGRGCQSNNEKSKAPSRQAVAEVQSVASAAGAQAYSAAVAVAEKEGLLNEASELPFDLVTTQACCGSDSSTEAPNKPKLNCEGTEIVFSDGSGQPIIEWGGLADMYAILLRGLGELFILLAFFSCPHPCTPANAWITCRVARTYVNTVGNNQRQGAFDVDWDYCCQNWCWVLWYEEWIVTVTTSHSAGPIVPWPRVRQAQGAARRLSAAAVTAFLNGGAAPAQVAPALAWPAAPAC